MQRIRPVVWSKGMFLTPQHFQAQESFFADNLHFRSSSACYANWGVTEVSINQATLANGVLTLSGCSGVLTDGLTFQIPDVDGAPAGRSVQEHFQPQDESLDVHLAIPEERPSRKNITHVTASTENEPIAPASTRYVAENVDIVDQNTGDEKKTVQVGRKNFRILFGDEILDGSTTLRIAQVVRDQTGRFVLSPEFIAPCLDIQSSPYLMGLVKRQIELLRTKTLALAAGRRQKGQDLADFSTTEVAHFWLLHTVNSYRPELQHIWKVRHGHPEPLFVAMLRLAGALSTFVLEEPAPEFPDYDHDNLGPCFTALDNQIRTMLETVIPSKCISVPLRLTANKSIWTGTITDDSYFRDSQFFLAMSSKLSVGDSIERVPNLVKIASQNELDHLVKYSMPSIGLHYTPAPPSAISFRMDNQYFALDQKNTLWENIVRSRNISLFVPSEIPDARMEILIVLK